MAHATRIPKAEITGLMGMVVKRMTKRMLGEVPEPLEVIWHHKQIRRFSMSVGKATKSWHECDENLKSYAQIAVASQVGCSFCLDYGYFEALNHGLDIAKAAEVPNWRNSIVFTRLERDVMEYAEAMSTTPPTVTDELSARLLEQLSPAAMVELTTHIGLANLSTRSNIAFGIKSQGFAEACGFTPREFAVAS